MRWEGSRDPRCGARGVTLFQELKKCETLVLESFGSVHSSQRGTQRESRNSREGVKSRKGEIPKMDLTFFSLLEVLTGYCKMLLSTVLK